MKLKKFTLSCLLTTITIMIEMIAATTGETLVMITVLSCFPLYLIAQISQYYCVISYLCIAVLLVIFNPHQMIFFAFTNGLLGVSLGISTRIKLPVIIRGILCGTLLFGGTCLSFLIIGIASSILTKFYFVIAIFIFCLGYATLVNFLFFKLLPLFEKLNLK